MIRRTAIVLLLCMFLAQPAFADAHGAAREKGLQYAKPLEVVMVDGPFYVAGDSYYVAEYVKPDSSTAASLVFDESSSTFTSNPETIRKVLATKDLKKLTVADPLFFALGDPSLLVWASKYETQNVRNFAGFSSITTEERNILEVFLKDYEDVMNRVANASFLTQNILYPDDAIEINLIVSPPSIEVELRKDFSGGHFSYEGFEALLSSYDALYHDYLRLSSDLAAFAGGLPEYQPGAIIREKWDVQITKEGILAEILLIEENGAQIKSDIDLRRDVLSYPFEMQVKEAQKRHGMNPTPPPSGVASVITGLFARIKNLVLGLFGLGGFILIARRRGPPGKGLLHIVLIGILLAGLLTPIVSYSVSEEPIPTMEELISKKVGAGDAIPYTNLAKGLNDSVVEELLGGFRLVFKGETAEVRGPYSYYKKPYYFFDLKKDGASTGNGFLVDAESFRLVGDQRQAYQLLKTLLFAELLKKKPLYVDIDAGVIERHAKETLESPLDLFLANLSVNIKEGAALEQELVKNPDFELLLNLTGHYVEAFILMQNINQLTGERESLRLTEGFSKKLFTLDSYSRATRGLSSQEYLQGRTAQYRGRTLNRLPLIEGLSLMGLRPSKAQVAHDLTSDLIYDNVYLWRKGTINNPNLFARLSFREGTFTMPESALEFTSNNSIQP